MHRFYQRTMPLFLAAFFILIVVGIIQGGWRLF
jgi:hypothetical protein